MDPPSEDAALPRTADWNTGSVRMGSRQTCWSSGEPLVRNAEQETGGWAVDRAEEISAMSEAEEGEMDWVRPWQ